MSLFFGIIFELLLPLGQPLQHIKRRQAVLVGLGRILNPEELAEIDRLLAQQVVGWEAVEISDRALLEEEAIQKLKIELENWE